MKTFAAVESQDVHLCTQHPISKLRAVKLPNATFFFKKKKRFYSTIYVSFQKLLFIRIVSAYP